MGFVSGWYKATTGYSDVAGSVSTYYNGGKAAVQLETSSETRSQAGANLNAVADNRGKAADSVVNSVINEVKTNPKFQGEIAGTVATMVATAKLGGGSKSQSYKVDLFGESKSSLKGYINYDMKAVQGIADDVGNFGKYFKDSSVSEVVANNPQAEFLNTIAPTVKSRGNVTIRGIMSNKYFNMICKNKANGLENYNILNKTENVSNNGYKTTTGNPIRGQINEVNLKRK
ncbi:MAG: hypothetical protein QM660_12720 [Dysgonomonas sp.]